MRLGESKENNNTKKLQLPVVQLACAAPPIEQKSGFLNGGIDDTSSYFATKAVK